MSGGHKSNAYASGLQQYGSAGVVSGLSHQEKGYTTTQGKNFNLPGVSRFPVVESGGAPQLKQNFMHLRTNNRSGLQSLDRNRGGGAKNRGGFLPSTGSNRRDSRLNYNSSSIPYLNKRGVVEPSVLSQSRDS